MRRIKYWLAALCMASMLLANGCGTDTKAETERSTVSVAENIDNNESKEKTDKAEESANVENSESAESVESTPQIEVESAYAVDIDEDLEGDFG